MKKYCDLHIHSRYSSDGQHEIKEILDMLLKNDVKIAAITDHNRIEGTLEFYELAQSTDIQPIKGVELSTRGKNHENIHILLYNIEKNADLIRDLKIINTQYLELAKLRIKKLNELGFHVTMEDVFKEQKIVPSLGPTIGSAILHNEKNSKDLRLIPYRNDEKGDYNFYKKYMREKDSPAYVEFHEYSVYDALKLAAKHNFIPVIAHPGYSLRFYDNEVKEEFIVDLVKNGLKGIEVYSSHHNKDDIEFFGKLCKKYDLNITGGSDFHGTITKPDITIEDNKVDCSLLNLKEIKIGDGG